MEQLKIGTPTGTDMEQLRDGTLAETDVDSNNWHADGDRHGTRPVGEFF